MADTSDFDFTKYFSGAIDWATANPGLVGAGIGGLGTLLDPAQAQTKTDKVELPDYIAPYANRMLNRFEGLSQEEYTPYSGPRVADFNQDQQAAFERYRQMNSNTPQQQQGAGIVGQAAQQLLDRGNQRFDQGQADFYMSPYQQSVTDIQKREAMNDYNKQLPVMAAQAQKAGAFGGDRQYILQAEAQKNMNQQLQDIQAKGLQSAFTNAQGQFNADQNRMGTSLTGAGTMGNTLAGIGQQGFQNQLAVNQGIMGIGNQQQGLEQKGLDIGYQNFVDQRDQPYKQAGFMASALNGLPMTQTNTATTTPAPSMTNQLIGNMSAGYGIGAYNPATGAKP
jgi:hypothetical protein